MLNYKIAALLLLLILAIISDLKTYKIKNKILLIFLVIGLIISIYENSLSGLFSFILGCSVPFFILLILYILRMLGAGDIKLFCVIGSIAGWLFALKSIVFSFVAGGVVAFCLILVRRNALERLDYLFTYFKSCYLQMSLLPYEDFKSTEDGSKMHFSICIAIGCIMSIFINL